MGRTTLSDQGSPRGEKLVVVVEPRKALQDRKWRRVGFIRFAVEDSPDYWKDDIED